MEAIEPDWVEHTECLGGVYEAYLIDDVLRSVLKSELPIIVAVE